ncbi:cohesin domain-containing protein [Candidatus Pacebacteria bacterium]|nr:cohesin domain-containing protein [Candidatus Paceibacterota bacterium]
MEVLKVRSYFLHKKLFLFGLFVAVSFFVVPLAYAADVVISPSTGTYNAGQTFTVTIQADPKGANINAVESTLSFDTSKLSVVSVSKTGSIFSLWTTEPTFSNSAGTIEFGGGSPSPFSARSTLVVVTFRTSGEGTVAVSFDSASVLAADGLGTDVLEASPSATYTISAAAEPVPAEETSAETPESEEESNAAIAFGDPPRAPEVGSQAFLDPELWYKETDGIFTWELPFDVTTVAVELATSSENDPSEVFDPPIEDFKVSSKNLIEGIQYLSVQFENQVGWGGITNRKIQIDTKPPESFKIDVQTANARSGFPLLIFDANDVTSGIEKYDMVIAGGETIEVTPDEAKLGYLLKELEDGTYTVKVTAYDKAGNITVSTVPVLITAGWIKASDIEEVSAFWTFFTGVNIFIVVLILLVLGEFGYILYERRQFGKTEGKLRKETREIQDQMEKIFSALRDEIYDQINTITKRPRLSKKEKEAVDGLNQALEVSETLIEKEINDVKKILK